LNNTNSNNFYDKKTRLLNSSITKIERPASARAKQQRNFIENSKSGLIFKLRDSKKKEENSSYSNKAIKKELDEILKRNTSILEKYLTVIADFAEIEEENNE